MIAILPHQGHELLRGLRGYYPAPNHFAEEQPMFSPFRLLLALAILLLPLSVVAQERSREAFVHEIRGGVLLHDVDLWGSGDAEDGIVGNVELAFRSFGQVLGGSIRPALGVSIAEGGQTSYGYADARWEYTYDIFFFGIGLGAAIHDGELHREPGRKDLGSRVLFHVPIEAGLHVTPQNRVSLYFEHVSNAWLAEPNPGMDNIGIRLSHRF